MAVTAAPERQARGAAGRAATSVAAWPSAGGVGNRSGGLLLWLERERPQWFSWLPVALGGGIAGYFALPQEPSPGVALLPFPVALLVWGLCRRGSLAAAVAGAILVAALGFGLAKLRADSVSAPVIERRMGPVEVRGYVELIEPRDKRGERLTLQVTAIAGLAADAVPRRVRVRTLTVSDGLKPGDAVRIKAHLAPPSGPALPGGYDFARGAFFQRLGGIGYALHRAEPDPEAGPPPRSLQFGAAVARLRQDIGARITAALPGQTGAIATALINGERGAISAATNDAYRDSGLFHMLSISGLHMAIMGGAVFVSVRFALALVPSVALRFPIKKWAAAAAILASLGYLMISGAAFATVRSAVTITIMFVAVLLDRPAIAMRNVALSALVILLIWPESLNDVGFQMSFAAVVALVACYEAARRRLLARPAWSQGPMAQFGLFFSGIVLSTLIASVAVAPFAAYYFHKSQQLAIVANVLATPICNLLIMPAALAALVLMPLGLEALPLAAMGFGIDLMTRCAIWVAGLPGAVTRIPSIGPTAFVLMIMGGLWLLLWRERPRVLGLAGLAMGVYAATLTERPDILVGRDGRLIAVRTAAGDLTALAAPQTGYELSRWLEAEGDARTVKAVTGAPGFRCDSSGCTARVQGLAVAHPRHAAALADDCARADILLMSVPRPRGCTRPSLVVDFFALRSRGTHAIYLNQAGDARPGSWLTARRRAPDATDPASGPATPGNRASATPLPTDAHAGGDRPDPPRGDLTAVPKTQPAAETGYGAPAAKPRIRVETVADRRGDRPWSRLPPWASAATTNSASAAGSTNAAGVRRAPWRGAPGRFDGQSRLWAFAATPEFLASQMVPRSDIDPDDATADPLGDPSAFDDGW